MDEELKAYLEGMEERLTEAIEAATARVLGVPWTLPRRPTQRKAKPTTRDAAAGHDDDSSPGFN